MKKQIALALVIAGLVAGCTSLPTKNEGSVTVGDTPRHIDAARCDEASRRVIDQEKLTQINGCDMEMVKLADGTSAYYVVIRYGPGMDCPAGCIYERKVAMVLPDRIAILPAPFMEGGEIRNSINSKLNIALPEHFLKDSDRHFVERDGQWQMVLTFHRYLDGTVIVHPTDDWSKGVELHGTRGK